MSPNEAAQYQSLLEPKEIHPPTIPSHLHQSPHPVHLHGQMLAFQAGLLPTCSEGLPERK